MLNVGPYTLAGRWILAPMAGVSEMPFRVIARELGAAAAPTELVSAKGLQYKNERTIKYLTHSPKEDPFWVQLFGGESEAMAIAAEMAVEAGAKIVDINMGCPVKKVTKTGAGSSLLCDPWRAAGVVKAIKARVSIPVTCKIRMGWDANNINCTEVAKALQDAGAAAIAMHARTRAQGYSGHADWSQIARLREVVKDAMLVGNGDVTSRDDALRMLAQTGCDAVMIGRAALGNPWIFRQLDGGEPAHAAEKAALIKRHLTEHVAFCIETTTGPRSVADAELRAVKQFRQHAIWYSRGLRGGKFFRERVVQLNTLEEVLALVDEFYIDGAALDHATLDEGDIDYHSALG